MSDGDEGASKREGIPAWQESTPKADDPAPATESAVGEERSPSDETVMKEGDRESSTEPASQIVESKKDLVEQGKKFLLDETIRNAPIDQKKHFLESRGLSKSDVDKAVNLSNQFSVRQSSNNPPLSPRPVTNGPAQQAPQSSPRDAPPIITYPEFLVHAQKPPPLITANRLLNTAYLATAVSTLVWGTSKYLVTPMLSTLTESRLDFASHSQEKLDEFNEKLKSAVSVDPKTTRQSHVDTPDDDAQSDDSDPTELFHRDYGTQTSPELLEVDNISDSSSNASDSDAGKPEMQSAKLNAIASHCKSLANDDIVDSTDDQSSLMVLRVLHEYLETLAYPSYTNPGAYSGAAGTGKKEDDELAKFKNEIRSVKGQLLSARNFPSSKAGARKTAHAG